MTRDRRPVRRRVGFIGVMALVGLVATAAAATVWTGSGPESTAPTTSPTGSVASAPPASAAPTMQAPTTSALSTAGPLGSFRPVLDIAEPTGDRSYAMHEGFGSAADGVVYLEDYLYSFGDGVLHKHVWLYRSFDGVHWQPVDVPTAADQQDAVAACRGWNCVVASVYPYVGTLFVTDDGRHWDRISPVPGLVMVEVHAGPGGFVLTGTTLKASVALFSTDGRHWEKLRFAKGMEAMQASMGGIRSDAEGGWLMDGTPGPSSTATACAVSSDGLNWEPIQGESCMAWNVFHYNARWYFLNVRRQMPAEATPTAGPPRRAVSSATPIAVWGTLSWLDDGDRTVRSAGSIFGPMPEQVVAMDGYLAGVRSNADGSATLLVSTDGMKWQERGPLPGGSRILRAGANLVIAAPSVEANRLGPVFYVAEPAK